MRCEGEEWRLLITNSKMNLRSCSTYDNYGLFFLRVSVELPVTYKARGSPMHDPCLTFT